MNNRIIKFRAWTKRDKCWCGAFVVHKDGMFRESPNNDWIDLDKQDEVVLTQFTGLTDKLGKEIWEGDIVKQYCHHENHKGSYDVCEIIWDDVYGKWYAWEHDQFLTIDDIVPCPDCHLESELLEVIGNVFENPEFLLL